MNILKRLFFISIVLFFFLQNVSAQFSKGTVVRLVNKSSGKVAVANASSVNCIDRNNDDYTQLWYVEDRYYNAIPIGYKVRLRNLSNGRYLQGNDNSSTPWHTVSEAGSSSSVYDGQDTQFTTELWEASRDGYYTLGAQNKKTGDTDYYYDKLHCSASGTCVSWMGASDGSLWTIELIDGVDVQAQWDKLAEIENQAKNSELYEGCLNTLFTDNLCTELKSEYNSRSALQNASAYLSLPQELKDMALKVCDGNWAETNRDNSSVSWSDKTARRFRVQTIEPYSVAEEACVPMKTSPYSNMNNPTGLYANNMDIIYIMVKGEIKQGASLSLASLLHSSKDYLTSMTDIKPLELHSGLNMIPYYGDKNMLYLIYSVNSTDSSYPLDNYPDIEVHIEGGCINGMYDASMNDKTRFNELKQNSSKTGLEYYDVLGEKFIFHTSRETVFDNNNATSIEKAIDVWDMIGTTQHLIMGVVDANEMEADPLKLHTYTSDFSKVHNNRQLVHTIPTLSAYTQSPYRIQFAHGEGLLRGDVMEKDGYIWGPAHEMGHANQNVINMVGTTEISNNLFSNLAVFYQDYLLSRGGTVADNCAGYKAGTAWHFRESDSRMRMLYQLWLYYHAAGKNKNFFPKLFEYLRNDPMSIQTSSAGDVYTSNESLKFYKYACRAAGEDLTPFFDAWGFFVPFEKSNITDYNTYSIISRESDIVAAKNEVASYGYNKNYIPIFIEDRIGDVISRKYSGHKKEWFGNALNVGTIGMYTDFVDNVTVNSDFVWVESIGNIVEISGEGGIAGVILESSGSMHSFFNVLEIELEDAVLNGLKSRTYKFKVVGVDGRLYDVKSFTESESDAAKRTVLKSMIDKTNNILDFVDDECCRIGYYNPIYTVGLELLIDKALAVYEKNIVDEYDSFIDKLVNELNKFEEAGDATLIKVVDGFEYMLENKLHTGRYMYLASNNEVDGTTSLSGNTYKWIFEYAGSGTDFYIKNKSNSRYIEEMTTYSQQVYADENSKSTAEVYRVEIADDRTVSFTGKTYLLHLDSWMNVVGWFNDAEASYWYMRRVGISGLESSMLKIEKMIEDVKWLVEEMAVNVSFNNTPSVGGVNAHYSWVITLTELSSAAMAVGDAVATKESSNVTATEIDAACNTLKQHYNILKIAYDKGNNAELRVARQTLNDRINELGSYVSGGNLAGKLSLQCDDENGNCYLSSNAEHNAGGGVSDGGGLPALIDELPSTFFHSRWAGEVVNEPHYLQIDMGGGILISEFCFNYSLRENLYHTVPTEIVISGSNDGVDFENITTLGREELVGVVSSNESDYSLNSNFATATKNSRKLSAVKLESPGCGVQTIQLTDTDKLYNDQTAFTFNVLPGETLTASFVKDGEWSWLHGYVYIDVDNNGFTASLNGTEPASDLMSYSFYGSESNENSGYNSKGVYLSGNERNVLDPPTFKAPTKPGNYRMRYKIDWNSIDPKGDNNSNFGGTIADVNGCIVDVMLRVGEVENTDFKASFTSDTIACGENYRYLRFTVTESACFVDSHNCGDEQMKYNGYYFFSMSEFGLTKIDNISTEGTWAELYIDEAETLLNKADLILANATSVNEMNTCSTELQSLIDTLKRAVNILLPVELTTNSATPVSYRIMLAENNLPLKYETTAVPNMYDVSGDSLNLVSFVDLPDNSSAQAWYFMKGSDVGQYYLYPLLGEGCVLGTNPEWSQVMQPGESRVWSVPSYMNEYITEWTIAQPEDGCFIISPVYPTNLVLGRYDSYSQKLGFVYDSVGDNTLFVFEKMEVVDTAIENVTKDENLNDSVVYDLFGRSVKRVVSPGIYIVNGKKKYINPLQNR